MAIQEAEDQLQTEFKKEQDELLQYFSQDKDLRQKIIVDGVKKVCVLGKIKYH